LIDVKKTANGGFFMGVVFRFVGSTVQNGAVRLEHWQDCKTTRPGSFQETSLKDFTDDAR
jgi:hypothetical protein